MPSRVALLLPLAGHPCRKTHDNIVGTHASYGHRRPPCMVENDPHPDTRLSTFPRHPPTMAGPTSPGSEGPTFGPPQLPPGWIAQWDGASKKYYFVQLSTGVSQWEVPTDAAPTGSTPAPAAGDHPYGVPRQQELITHPDGSQTVRYADGSLEPVNPSMPQDGSRGLGDGPSGDRGLGVRTADEHSPSRQKPPPPPLYYYNWLLTPVVLSTEHGDESPRR